jgi:hypothetical protein
MWTELSTILRDLGHTLNNGYTRKFRHCDCSLMLTPISPKGFGMDAWNYKMDLHLILYHCYYSVLICPTHYTLGGWAARRMDGWIDGRMDGNSFGSKNGHFMELQLVCSKSFHCGMRSKQFVLRRPDKEGTLLLELPASMTLFTLLIELPTSMTVWHCSHFC